MKADIYDTYAAEQPVRGTQQMVDHMGWVFRRPRITLLELVWRWLFAVPFLYVCWQQIQLIAVALPPGQAGANLLNTQNPWIDGVQLGVVWMHYLPYVLRVLVWLAPLAFVAWSLVSGLGRALVLRRIDPGVPYRPLTVMFCQGCWLALLLAIFVIWYAAIQWIAATHIKSVLAPDLVGYSVWAIFVSLGLFVLWAVVSWPFTIAPIIALEERRSILSALAQSFRLGKTFTAELIEINLTMGIIKLMVVVLAMVFSSAPLPFSDVLGPGAMKIALCFALLIYCVGSDFFHLVRLKAFINFWQTFRGHAATESRSHQLSV